MSTPLHEVLAERTLVPERSPGEKVIVRLGKPHPAHGGAEYQCPYQIIGFGREVSRYGAGIDAFQSIRVALFLIRAEIIRLNMDATTRLQWPEGVDAPNCGFDELKFDT